MDYFPCSNSPECPFRSKGCYEDVHHNYQVEKAMTGLMRIFRNIPDNKVLSCRWVHTKVLDPVGYPYPEPDAMRSTVIEAVEAGNVTLTANKQKIIYGNL